MIDSGERLDLFRKALAVEQNIERGTWMTPVKVQAYRYCKNAPFLVAEYQSSETGPQDIRL